MKTYNEIKNELSDKDLSKILLVLGSFVLKNGYPKSLDDQQWQKNLSEVILTLPINLQNNFVNLLYLHVNGELPSGKT